VLGVERDVVIEDVEFDEDAAEIVVSCRVRHGVSRRCGRCRQRCGRYDQGEGRRRWRALDAGTIRVFTWIHRVGSQLGCCASTKRVS